ncbi:MAG: hypothetical protein HQL04_00770 [Nitrospirae bacterium]|nr:hypothetical protein [Nitrospirota bacterium]
MKNTKAIITMTIGRQYQDWWNELCKPNWQVYGQRHGYDIICIDSALDNSERAGKRSPAWQKCLILSEGFSSQYERVVWVDADIVINALEAPSITDTVPYDKVGAINVWTSPTAQWFKTALQRYMKATPNSHTFSTNPDEYYEKYGLPTGFRDVVQTGVLVLSATHREILERTYYQYEEKGGPEWNYEMRPLSYELLKAGVVNWIDNRFNMSWPIYKNLFYPFLISQTSDVNNTLLRHCVRTTLSNGYFLHFPGSKFPDMTFAAEGP